MTGGRGARGRFTSGNEYASHGGQARAAKLTPERRRAIARAACWARVLKRFAGDEAAAKSWWASRGHDLEVKP